MALSSQSSHSTGGRRYMSSRRKRGRRLPTLIILVIVGLGIWYFWPEGDSENGDENLVVGGESAAVVEPQPQPVIEPVAEPVESPVETRPQPVIEEPTVEPQPQPVVEAAAPVEPQPVVPASTTLIADATGLMQAGKLVDARQMLSDAIFTGSNGHSMAELAQARSLASQINETLIFSKRIVPDDPLVTTYVIEPNDALSRIAPGYKTPYELLTLINGISNPNRIRVGQRLKVVKGPFHAIVDKTDFRMDVYLMAPDGRKVFVRSFPVGLGEDDSTPIGQWAVRNGSKLKNPRWTDPVTGKSYGSGAADNPIGKFWIGIRGTDANTKDLSGYGIHGTIDPGSIGQMASMGCVRMHGPDIELVYKLLVEKYSTVEIRR